MRFYVKGHLVAHRRGGSILTATILVCAVAAAPTAILTASALASSATGSVSETIYVGVRSLTVSPSTVSMCSGNPGPLRPK
jgi:hypothetical protein